MQEAVSYQAFPVPHSEETQGEKVSKENAPVRDRGLKSDGSWGQRNGQVNHRRGNGLDLTMSDHSVCGGSTERKEEQQTASVGTGCVPPCRTSIWGIGASRSACRSSVGFPVCHVGGLDELTS